MMPAPRSEGRSGLTRRGFLALTAAAVAAGACSRGGSLPDFSGTLRVLNWSDYIDPETVSRFEQASNIPVDYVEEYNGNEEAFDEIFEPTLGRGRSSGYDVVVPPTGLSPACSNGTGSSRSRSSGCPTT